MAEFAASQAAVAAARAAVAAAKPRSAGAKQAQTALDAALKTFAQFTDPRTNLPHFPDRSPFAMLPVRIETRFVTIPHGEFPTHQLLVRIYPDDCSIDTFEADLSANELANAKLYWQAIWAAGGVEADERAAWRALVAAHGSGRAAWIVQQFQPVNLAAKPAKGAPAVDMVLPPDPPVKTASWSRAPRVTHLADRFVVIGYNGGVKTLEALGGLVTLPLYVGPDPSIDPAVDPSGAIHPDGGDLFVPDELRWLVDFDAAVAAGMGVRADISAAQASSGFDRLLVVGVQSSASDADGKIALEDLLRHHRYGLSGLELIAQGTPAHNTTGTGTGYTRHDDPDRSFDDRKNAPLFALESDPERKRDGQWLAELLGVDPALLLDVHGAGGRDQMQARAMQRALWPATLGYWMDKLLAPVFDDATVEQTRLFFTRYVTGRGAIPALRIGGQPYGVLPTTAFSRIHWLDRASTGIAAGAGGAPFLARLYAVLREIGADWAKMREQVSYVDKPGGDAHQTLLDIVGLHPASAEFHARYAETVAELFNTMNLSGFGGALWKAILTAAVEQPAIDLLQRFGYGSPRQEPDIVGQLFLKDARQIANVVDDLPLSETDPIRAYTDDGKNYVDWLIAAAKTSLDALNIEHGFSGGKTPETLLYLYLRHALMLGYFDTSYELHRARGVKAGPALQALKPEPIFVHVADAAASESRFAALYKTEPAITGHPGTLVCDYITANLFTAAESARFAEQLDALGALADAPTAALERAFAEHVDCCTYRYDAWLLGLVNYQLQRMRTARSVQGLPMQTGAYLGAYAWVENLRPSKAVLSFVQPGGDLAQAFAGAAPLMHDSTNGGYVHAPSLTHAKTAAVLRSGYLANATPANPDTMSVNLSSARVRLALGLLEGIRNGQKLGALLGYRFERGLHDDHGLVEVDKFIYPLRKAFPLAADAIATTATPPDVPIEAIEARNVMDGLKLIERVRASNVSAYPFGLGGLPAANALEAAAIDAQVNAMLDAHDAIADLALAEGVHQAVQGNFARIGATLDAYASGNFPPEPDVAQTPPSGAAVTHRVAVQFVPGLPPPLNATPRATAEPALDAWLESVLPPLSAISCTVTWTDPVTATPRSRVVSLADLGVRPIDVLQLVKPDDAQAMSELDDRVIGFVLATDVPRPDAALHIAYMTAGPGSFSIFEATALVRKLRALTVAGRPLRATDAKLHGDASSQDDAATFVDIARITGPKALLDALHADVTAVLAPLQALLLDTVANRAALVAGIDGVLAAASALLERAARFGVPSSGWGFAAGWRQTAFAELVGRVRGVAMQWTSRLADYDARITAYDALPLATPSDARFVALRDAELLVTTVLDPFPPDPATLRTALDGKRAAFAAARDALEALAAAPATSFAATLAAAQAIPTAGFDKQPLVLSDLEDRAVAAAQDAARALAGHADAIAQRGAAAQAGIDASIAAATPAAAAEALQAAAKALFGDDFVIVPEFALAPAHGDEWANSYAASTGGALTQYLTATLKIDFPVDEWLYGAARVRPVLHAWEQATILAGALGRTEPALTPVQFPSEASPAWVALEYPPDYVLDSDRLLYTAQYAAPFDKTARQCGLLLDEWTEVIPASARDTGITFNFDRPDNEAPQSILLVTPALATGAWQWDDLLGALNETLDLAKTRAVEPAHVDETAYARFLPATVLAVTTYAISISTALAAANGVFRYLEVQP